MIGSRGLVEVQQPKDSRAEPKTFTFDSVYGPEYVAYMYITNFHLRNTFIY